MADFVKFHFDNTFYDKPISFSPFEIVQVGDIDTYSGYKCVKHTQIAHEITYIVHGNATMLCDDKTYLCKTGDLIFNPKGTAHAIDSADGHALRYYYIAFDIADKSGDCERQLYDFFITAKAGCVTADRSIPHTFHDIFLNLYGKDELSSAIVADSIRKLLIYALRSLEGAANQVYVPDVRFGKKRTVAQICSFIDSNIEDISVLKKLPEKFGYSYSHISSFFSKSLGLSLKEYFLMSRHRRACELLGRGMSVTAVAERMGYSSIHVFSKAFSNRENISPSAYALKYKSEVKS
ncbi:MAG: helix-turn-helix transcriptional regulator [Clostridia bacterium]|nr:helix-turn-helix transcriptional regulator [Clostridia bacterium]